MSLSVNNVAGSSSAGLNLDVNGSLGDFGSFSLKGQVPLGLAAGPLGALLEQGQGSPFMRLLSQLVFGVGNEGPAQGPGKPETMLPGIDSPGDGDDSAGGCHCDGGKVTAPGVEDTDGADGPRRLADSAGQLDDIADRLKGERLSPEFRKVEAAIDEVRSAAERLAENPKDTEAMYDMEAAASKLHEAVKGLEGEMDPGAYRALEKSTGDFEKAVDGLNGGDDSCPATMHDKMNGLADQLDQVADNLENMEDVDSSAPCEHGEPGPKGSGEDGADGPSCDKPVSTNATEPTWQVDQENREVQLDNGYKLNFDNNDQSWTITDADGNSTNVWGDPHVKENDGGSWDFKNDSTFMLEDGTKISVHTANIGGGLPVTDSLTITKGDQAVLVTGIADNNVRISEVMSNGQELDAAVNDGHMFFEKDGVDDWMDSLGAIITNDQAMGEQLYHEEGA